MKVLFSWCHLFDDDEDRNCKLGLDWYGFEPISGCRPDLKGSKGFSVIFYCIWRSFRITWIKDYKAHQARMNYRHSSYLKEKL